MLLVASDPARGAGPPFESVASWEAGDHLTADANTPPLMPPIPPPAVRRRRGAKFWLIVSALVLLILPLVVFVALVFYVRMGMLNATVANELSSLFGIHAQVGSVSTNWLENLNIEKIQVDAANSGKPLTVDGVHVDWDFGPLLYSGRIRALRIDKPALDLKRASDGRWNFTVKTSESNEPSTQIEQIVLQNGDFAIGSDTQQFIHLKDAYASFTNTGRPAPRSFTLRGTLDSGEPLAATGSLGPGENLAANVNGGALLEKDFPALTGVTGKLNYELSIRRDAVADAKTPLPLKLSGRFELEKIQSTLAPGLDMTLANRNLQLQTLLSMSAVGATTVLTESKVTLDQVGSIAAEKISTSPSVTTIENASANLDLAGLKALVKLPASVDGFDVLGTLRASNVSATLPRTGEIHAGGDLATSDVRVSVPGIGELPPVGIQARLDWPALTKAKVNVGSVLSALFQIHDLRPDPWGQNEAPWASLSADTTVQELDVDIGQFMQSDAGRKLFYAGSKTKGGISPELPFAFDGQLSVKNVRPTLAHGADGHSGVTISGLKLRDFALHRWPLPMRVPALVLGGDVTAQLGSDNNYNPVALSGTLTETLAKGQPTNSGLSGEFSLAFGPDEKGLWRAKPVQITKLALPWAALNRIVNVSDLFGVTVDGTIMVTRAVYDPISGDASAHVEIDAPALIFPLPEQLQPMIVNALRAAHYNTSAAVLETVTIPSAKFTKASAALDVKMVGGQLTVTGVTHGGTLNVKPPLAYLPEVALFTLPDLDFTYLQSLEPGETGSNYALKLGWLKTNALNVGVFRGNDETWKLQGNFQGAVTGGKSVAFDGVFEPLKAQAGPVSISVDALDATALNAIAAMMAPNHGGIPNPASGEIQNLKLEMQPLSLRGSPLSKTINAKLTGKFAKFGARFSATDRVELSGPLVCILNYTNGTLGINTLLTLEQYAGECCGFKMPPLPPPLFGKAGSLKLAGKLSSLPDAAGTQFQIENADLNLASQITASADGRVVSDNVVPVSEIHLDHFRVSVADLNETGRAFLAANLNGTPANEMPTLAGGASLFGDYTWNVDGRSRLVSTLNLRKADVVIVKPTLTLRGASGDIPLILQRGTWKDEKKMELTGTLNATLLESGAVHLDNPKIHMTARPNELTFSEPLAVEPITKALDFLGIKQMP